MSTGDEIPPIWRSQLRTTGDAVTGSIPESADTLDCVTGDGRMLVACGHGASVSAWALDSGRRLWTSTAHTDRVNRVRCAEVDGRSVVLSASKDTTVRVADLFTGEEILTLPGQVKGATDVICTEVDGVPVAVVGCRDKKLRVWDLATGKRIRVLTGHGYAIKSLDRAWLDGRVVAVSCDDLSVMVWDLTSGACVAEYSDKEAHVFSVHCAEVDSGWTVAYRRMRVQRHRNGKRVNEIVLQDLRGGEPDVCGPISGTAITADDSGHLLVGRLGAVRLWDLKTARLLRGVPTDPRQACDTIGFGRWGEHAVAITAGRAGIRGWDIGGADVVRQHADCVTTLAPVRRADGTTVLVSGSDDTMLRAWDAGTGREHPFVAGTGRGVRHLEATEIDRRPVVVSSGHGPHLHVWDIERPHPIRTIRVRDGQHDDHVLASIDFGGEELMVTAMHDLVRVWDVRSGSLRCQTSVPPRSCDRIACAQIDGTAVLIGVDPHGAVSIFALFTGELFGSVTPHAGPITTLATATLGGTPVLVSGGHDRAVRVVDLSTREQVRVLTGHTGIVDALGVGELAGRAVAASASRDGSLRVWELATGEQINVVGCSPGRIDAVTIADEVAFVACGPQIQAHRLAAW